MLTLASIDFVKNYMEVIAESNDLTIPKEKLDVICIGKIRRESNSLDDVKEWVLKNGTPIQ